jgi:low affinity Fe/Cu permease
MDKSDKSFFEKFSDWATKFTGSSYAFIGATLIVIIWGLQDRFLNIPKHGSS